MASRPRKGRIVAPEDTRDEQEDAHEVDDQRAEDQEGVGAATARRRARR